MDSLGLIRTAEIEIESLSLEEVQKVEQDVFTTRRQELFQFGEELGCCWDRTVAFLSSSIHLFGQFGKTLKRTKEIVELNGYKFEIRKVSQEIELWTGHLHHVLSWNTTMTAIILSWPSHPVKIKRKRAPGTRL
jgi:hypothetical protein